MFKSYSNVKWLENYGSCLVMVFHKSGYVANDAAPSSYLTPI